LPGLKWTTPPLPLVLAVCLFSSTGILRAQQVRGGDGIVLPPPPPTAVHMVTEHVGGHNVEDPYQWLEDQQSPQTRAWITEQNKYTQDYLSQLKNRPAITAALDKLQKVNEESTPTVRAGRYFYYLCARRTACA
jgi:prolyl oligopeptidase